MKPPTRRVHAHPQASAQAQAAVCSLVPRHRDAHARLPIGGRQTSRPDPPSPRSPGLSPGAFALTLTLTLVLATCARQGEVLRPANGDGGDPVTVILHVSDVRLSAGQEHSCAVVGGGMICWGQDADGRLGTVASAGGGSPGPVAVAVRGSWVAPAAGDSHSCGLTAEGGVWCWGANALGQLGAGDVPSGPEPREVPLPDKALDVRTAFDHTCALLVDASLWCWGFNREGQLGLGDGFPGANHALPIQVGTARDWVFVATGQGHTCGIRSPGRLYCWGRNTDFELGQGSVQPQQIRVPVPVGSDSDWIDVACGQGTTCARKRDGTLYCWGEMGSGALGSGDVAARATPARVPLFDDWLSVTANVFHTCGVRAGGTIWCAGRGTEGQIGADAIADAVPAMQQADPTSGWVEVRAGRFFTCGRKSDDSLWCQGTNASGQLAADPSVTRSPIMRRIR